MKKEIKTEFNFSFAKLKQLSDTMLQMIDRDATEFANRGFTDAKREAFATQITIFDDLPADAQLEGMKQTATQNKDDARMVLEIEMRTIINMVQIAFKNFPGKQAEFGAFDLTRQSDDELVRTAKALRNSATKYVLELGTEGLTTAKIATVESHRVTLDINIDLQQIAITQRNVCTENRRIEANKLYAILVENSIRGKSIFAEISQAKYSDYLIYNTSSGAPDPEIPALK